MRQRLLLFLLLLLPGASALQAAEPVTSAAEEDRVTEAPADDEAELDEDEEPASDETPETAARGSGDFVPSVQISEDLSVSFPTDI